MQILGNNKSAHNNHDKNLSTTTIRQTICMVVLTYVHEFQNTSKEKHNYVAENLQHQTRIPKSSPISDNNNV